MHSVSPYLLAAVTKKTQFPKRCPCGLDLSHPLVQPTLRFSILKWAVLCMGATPYPTRVDYTCSRCNTVLDSTTRKEVLETF
jgi:hypothetical protein